MIHQQPIQPTQLSTPRAHRVRVVCHLRDRLRLEGLRVERVEESATRALLESIETSLLPPSLTIAVGVPRSEEFVGDELSKEGRRGSDGGGAEIEEEGDHDGRDGFPEGVVGGSKGDAEIDLREGVSDMEETRDVVGGFDDVSTLNESKNSVSEGRRLEGKKNETHLGMKLLSTIPTSRISPPSRVA